MSGTARNFTWDANSRLKTWVKGGTTIDYHYDAYGRRVSDGERRYIYCHGWRVCEERDLSDPQTDITDGSLVAMPLLKTIDWSIRTSVDWKEIYEGSWAVLLNTGGTFKNLSITHIFF